MKAKDLQLDTNYWYREGLYNYRGFEWRGGTAYVVLAYNLGAGETISKHVKLKDFLHDAEIYSE